MGDEFAEQPLLFRNLGTGKIDGRRRRRRAVGTAVPSRGFAVADLDGDGE